MRWNPRRHSKCRSNAHRIQFGRSSEELSMRSTTCCRKALSLWLFRRCSVWDRWIIGADYHPRRLWEGELSHGLKAKPLGCKGGFFLWLQPGWVDGRHKLYVHPVGRRRGRQTTILNAWHEIRVASVNSNQPQLRSHVSRGL